MTAARNEYDDNFTEARERTFGSAIGFAEFCARNATTDEPRFYELCLAVLNRVPGAAEAFRQWFYDEIEQDAQREASNREMNVKPRQFDASRFARSLMGIPQEPQK